MSYLGLDEPGKELLLMGNEAIARGALEAGVKVCAAYPGTPSSEIIGSLSEVAHDMDLYVEWSVNEKVAFEVAASAAFSGLIWDAKSGKAKIDEVICVGCGVCSDICPKGAIVREEMGGA